MCDLLCDRICALIKKYILGIIDSETQNGKIKTKTTKNNNPIMKSQTMKRE